MCIDERFTRDFREPDIDDSMSRESLRPRTRRTIALVIRIVQALAQVALASPPSPLGTTHRVSEPSWRQPS
jgi:hypothetical protein